MTSSPSFLPGLSDSEPAVLSIGTEVSAKYKGAFCEAKIKNIARLVRCRVSLKGAGPSVVVADENITGPLRVGASVEVKHNTNQVEGVITKIMDGSQYTVIFDDGDETTLKRTSLCLKSGKHYSESESLDHLPLTNPEHFGNPVRGGRSKRKRMRGVAALTSGTCTSSNSYPPSDLDDNESAEEDTVTGSLDGDDDSASNITQQSLPKDDGKEDDSRSPPATPVSSKPSDPQQENIGTVFIVEYSEKRGNKAKDTWYPALVVSHTTTEQNTVRVDPAHEFLVKSFKDNRFYCVNQKDVKPFDRAICSSLNDANSSAALRTAVEKSIAYIENRDLPASWDADLLLASSADDEAAGIVENDQDSLAAEDSGLRTDLPARDEQPSEEKDRFVAQLYKFMDERGTPINRAPSVNGKDLDLYRLYTLVNEMGGYNKISSKDVWKSVYYKSDLPPCSSDSMENVAINQLKAAYKKYLLNFTDFYRKLGYSTSFVNSPIASRASSRPARNERSWRSSGLDIVKDTPSAKSSRRRKSVTESDVKQQPPPSQLVEEVQPEPIEELKAEGDESSVTSSGRRGSIKKLPRKVLSSRKKPASKTESSESEEPAADSIPDPEPSIESDPETDASTVKTISKDVEVNTGDKIRVKYRKGAKEHIYEAKIIKSEKCSNPAEQRFYVHYAGWNTRYDEWIKRNRIVQVVRDKSPKRRGGFKGVRRSGPPPEPEPEPEPVDIKSTDPSTPSKRSRGSAPSQSGRLSTDSAKVAPIRISKIGKKSRRFGENDTESCDEVMSKNEDSQASSVSNAGAAKSDQFDGTDTDLSETAHVKESRRVSKHEESKDASEHVEHVSSRRLSVESSGGRSSNRFHREKAAASDAPAAESRTEEHEKKRHVDREDDSTEEEDSNRSSGIGMHRRRKTKSYKVLVLGDEKEILEDAKKQLKRASPERESRKKSKPVRGSKNREDAVKHELEEKVTSERKRKTDLSPSPSDSTDDLKHKRKRSSRDQDNKHPDRTISSKKDEGRSKQSKEDMGKKEDEDVNMEIARLFDDEKSNVSHAAPESSQSSSQAHVTEKENTDSSSTFLLCREEVPLSPVPAQSSEPSNDRVAGKSSDESSRAGQKEDCKSEPGNNNGHFSPPTTPESLRSGTLSSLTPPHDREGNDMETAKSNGPHVSDVDPNDVSSKERTHVPAKNVYASPPHLSDDSASSGRCGPSDMSHVKDVNDKSSKPSDESAVNSPKRKRRGRARTSSTSEAVAANEAEVTKKSKYCDKNGGYKTRGSSAKRSSRYQDHDRYSPVGSASEQQGSQPISPISGISVPHLLPNAFFANIQPISKYNFCTPLPEDLDSDRRIQVLNERIQELRKTYINLKAELATVERRRRKCKRKANSSNSSNNGNCPDKRLNEKNVSEDVSSSDASDKVSNARETTAT